MAIFTLRALQRFCDAHGATAVVDGDSMTADIYVKGEWVTAVLLS